MSALGHMLERRGFATVAIGAVREQMAKTRPPRGLWTSSQLGRPFGEPEDPGFQRRVLMAALGLLERTDGPVILADFADDPPGWADNPGWHPPAVAAAGFADELSALMPLWRKARTRFGRTTVGLSFQPVDAWPGFAEAVLAGGWPVVAGHDTTALAVRFLADDIKAFYGEAAQAEGAAPSSHQVDTWFWHHTRVGRLLQVVRKAAMASENNALKTVGGRLIVPTPWVVA